MNSVMNFNNTTAAPFFDGACHSVRCIFSLTEKSIIAATFFAVVIVSLTGNISICYVILTRNPLRNTANLSTLNLAISDLLVTIVCAPVVTIDFYIAKSWIFGEVLCKIVPAVQRISVNTSIISLFIVSFEKFMAICHPFCFRARKRSFAYGMPIVWFLAIAVSAPPAKYRKLFITSGSSYCMTHFPDQETAKLFAVINTSSFLIPMVIMLSLQLTTIYNLSKKGITGSVPYMSQHNIRRRKAAVVLVVVMLSFLACWTPIYALSFSNYFSSSLVASMKPRTLNILYAIFTWMFYACAAVHPFIYFFMTPQGSKTLARRLREKKGQKESRKKLISRPFRSNTPSTAGSNIGSFFFTKESRV